MTGGDEGRLEQIKARHAAASCGPWSADEDEYCWRLHAGAAQILKAPKQGTPYAEYWPSTADGALLTHAHDDIAFLLTCIETGLSRLAYLEGVVTGLENIGHPIAAGTARRAVDGVRRALAGTARDWAEGPSFEPSFDTLPAERLALRSDRARRIGSAMAGVSVLADFAKAKGEAGQGGPRRVVPALIDRVRGRRRRAGRGDEEPS